MLTETISGKCPCCNYNKLLQRYGSSGYYELDGCPKCGFGFGSNQYDLESKGVEAWMEYGLHIVSCIKNIDFLELDNLTYYQKREMVFKTIDNLERCDDLETTVFEYSKEEIENYKKTKPLILSSKLLIEFL